MLAGPLLGSRGVLENMSGWNAAGKLLDPSLLGLSGSATITGDGGGGDGGGGEGLVVVRAAAATEVAMVGVQKGAERAGFDPAMHAKKVVNHRQSGHGCRETHAKF